MRIVKTKQLNRRQCRAIAGIVDKSNAYDGTDYDFPEDADIYYLLYLPVSTRGVDSYNISAEGKKSGKRVRRDELAAYIALYSMGDSYDGRRIYELSAATMPDRRQSACFDRLLSAAHKRIEDTAVRYAVYESKDVKAALLSRGAQHDHDELMLGLDLNGLQAGTGERPEDYEADDKAGHVRLKYSECWYRLSENGKEAYVFGVRTDADHLGEGHAYRMLKALCAGLAEKGAVNMLLQVSSDNAPALRLYDKLGMKEISRLSYYYELF